MHRIIAEVTAQRLKINVDDVTALMEQITGLLRIDQTKDNPVEKFQWIPFGRTILKQFSASGLAVIAELQNNSATVLQNLGDYEGALSLLRKTLEIFKKVLPAGHPYIAQAKGILQSVQKEWKTKNEGE